LQPPAPLAPGEEQRLSALPKGAGQQRPSCPRAAGQPSVLPRKMATAGAQGAGAGDLFKPNNVARPG